MIAAWRRSSSSMNFFREIENDDPTVDPEVATIDAGGDDSEITSGLGVCELSGIGRRMPGAKAHCERG